MSLSPLPPAACRHRCTALALAWILAGSTWQSAAAFSLGAPICEVNSLPLVEMSPTLADPPPTGWRLVAAAPVYVSGQSLPVRVSHADPQRRARGVLLWAKSGPNTGAGRFLLPPGKLYQYVPAPANCAEWALSHASPVPKAPAQMQFEWQPESIAGTVILRAFIIEDCAQPSGGCRAHQALTDVLVLAEALFVNGFED